MSLALALDVAPVRRAVQLPRDRIAPVARQEAMALQSQDVGTTDAVIVERIATADERALGHLYDRFGRMAYSLAAAIVPDVADAEEVVADAFAQIWRSAAK